MKARRAVLRCDAAHSPVLTERLAEGTDQAHTAAVAADLEDLVFAARASLREEERPEMSSP